MFEDNASLSDLEWQVIPKPRTSCRETPVANLWLCPRQLSVNVVNSDILVFEKDLVLVFI